MQSKNILLSSILCSTLVASFAFADATNANAQVSQNSANGGGAFN